MISSLTEHLLVAIKASLEAGKAILKVYNSDNFEIEQKSDNTPLTVADRRSHEIIARHLGQSKVPLLSEEGRDIPFVERHQWEWLWIVDPLDGTKEFIKRNGEFTVNIALVHKQKPVLGVIFVPTKDQLFFAAQNHSAFQAENVLSLKADELTLEKLLAQAEQLPRSTGREKFAVVASRSHLNDKTAAFIDEQKKKHGDVEVVSKGSSLKFCLVAQGKADVYPRYAPTMEWDTAAGHAIANESGATVLQGNSTEELKYNKENLLNPEFVVWRAQK